MLRIELYADGSAINNGAAGSIGYAAVLYAKGERKEFSAGARMDPASNNRAELLGIDLGLSKIRAMGLRKVDLLVFSDSEWAIKKLRGEYGGTEHEELVASVRSALRQYPKVELCWIRGHVGHALQERAHNLAKTAAHEFYNPETPIVCPQNLVKSLLAPRTRKPSSAGSSRKVGMPASKPVSGVSLTQARLDLIWNQTPTYHRSFVRWIGRMTRDPNLYPPAEIVARRYDLGAEIASLKKQVVSPPETMPAADWISLKEQLSKLEGQAAAIEWVLERQRQARTGTPARRSGSPSSAPGSTASITTAATERDPFINE